MGGETKKEGEGNASGYINWKGSRTGGELCTYSNLVGLCCPLPNCKDQKAVIAIKPL